MSFALLAELIQLPDRVAVITGGNRGIGIHVVQKLLRCGMTVVMGETTEYLLIKLQAMTNERVLCISVEVVKMRSMGRTIVFWCN